ncbi:6371_t:CDS:2, partial [Racocetra persica]
NQKQITSQSTSNTEEIIASSSKEITAKTNQEVIKNFNKKLLDFAINSRNENKEKYYGDEFNSMDKQTRGDLSRFRWLKDLINYEKYSELEVIRLAKKLQIHESDEKLSEIYEDEAASTSEGKEIIKAEISQELTKAKDIFENFKLSEVSQEEIQKKIERKWEKLYQRRIYIAIPTQKGVFGGVKKLVNNAIGDLENQRNKIVKKINKLIDARNEEVAEAREVIKALEIINQEAKNKNVDLQAKNKDLNEKSDRKIKNLQEQIKELNEQLKGIQEREEKLKEFRTKQLAREFEEKNKVGEKRIKGLTMSPEETIKDLEKRLEET